MLSCAVVDSITSIDWRNRWLIFLNTKGYLRHLVESLLLEDENLQTALNPSPEPLKSLYVYESRMVSFSFILNYDYIEYNVIELEFFYRLY